MAFSSVIFVCAFLPAVCLLYWAVPGVRAKNALLIAASLIFYSFGNPFDLLVLLGSVLCSYLAGLLVTRPRPWGRVFLALAAAVDLGLLAFYKYLGFVVENINLLFGSEWQPPGAVLRHRRLPGQAAAVPQLL